MQMRSFYVLSKMLDKIYEEAINKNDNTHEMDTLLLVTTMIEERLAINNIDYVVEENNSYFDKLRILIIDIYQLHRLVRMNDVKDIKNMIEDLKLLSNIDDVNINDTIRSIEDHAKSADKINKKIIFASIIEILSEIKELKSENKIVYKEAI